MTAVRLEPLTRLVSAGLAFGLLLILTLTWLGGGWWRYRLGDYFHNGFQWLGVVIVRPAQEYGRTRSAPAVEGGQNTSVRARKPTARIAASLLLGLLLALPLLALLALLLASADPIFAREIESVLEILRLENLFEYSFRLAYILILAYILTGVLLYALIASRAERVSSDAAPAFPPFLSWVTAGVVLLSVDILFLAFVIVQFRYFFGGETNIGIDGMTYSQYARRGFGELVAVALISLMIFLGLSAVTRRSPLWPRRIFSGLGAGLVGLVIIMLVSAFQRLFLYESAYGFSRLRTYTHVFMVWLGALLIGILLLEILGRLNFLPLAALLAGVGFGASLALVNVDGLIVEQNVARAVRGQELDATYLTGLSDDAAPRLFALYNSPDVPLALRQRIGGVLACREAIRGEDTQPIRWPSFHLSRWRAGRLYEDHQDSLDPYSLRRVGGTWAVTMGKGEVACEEHSW
jgi:hypothetical protein